jgi:hypothetical protein
MDLSLVPLLAVLVSLVAVVPILLSSTKPNLREFWTILAAAIKFGLVTASAARCPGGRIRGAASCGPCPRPAACT